MELEGIMHNQILCKMLFIINTRNNNSNIKYQFFDYKITFVSSQHAPTNCKGYLKISDIQI